MLVQHQLSCLFENYFGEKPTYYNPLAPAASYRRYYRLSSDNYTAIGAHNQNIPENRAFFALTQHFTAKHLPVPALYAVGADETLYLQQDLGDITFYDQIAALQNSSRFFPDELTSAYQQIINALLSLQIVGNEGLDYSVCYPDAVFDQKAMLWDCHYFKYCFLKPVKIEPDARALEFDFDTLTRFLLQAPAHFFMHRDCQSRNIMLQEGKPYFIDYQGGRQGALQYDLASLLFQARANLPTHQRAYLLQYYMQQAANQLPHFDAALFEQHYYGFVLMRCLQLLGAYGFRGLYERKQHFIGSIGSTLQNLEWVLQQTSPYLPLPTIQNAIEQVIALDKWKPYNPQLATAAPLTVIIKSFSYRQGIPTAPAEPGGGFVFDCRALHNPGRYPFYQTQSGLDKPVADFLKAEAGADEWLSHVFALVDQSVENYLSRNFTQLHVYFGCTGGQHRSVFCAEELARHLRQKYGVKTELLHTNRQNWVV